MGGEAFKGHHLVKCHTFSPPKQRWTGSVGVRLPGGESGRWQVLGGQGEGEAGQVWGPGCQG